MTKRDLFLPGSGEFCRHIGACDAALVGEKLFISGQGGVDWTDNMKLLPTFEAQTRKTWVNIKTALDTPGSISRPHATHIDDSEGTFSYKSMKIFEIKNEILPDSTPTGTTYRGQ